MNRKSDEEQFAEIVAVLNPFIRQFRLPHCDRTNEYGHGLHKPLYLILDAYRDRSDPRSYHPFNAPTNHRIVFNIRATELTSLRIGSVHYIEQDE
ncbi:MAG: hypothetical protein OXI44_05560 [Bacteroidota bacterium]|nr:hypothetical protein [Bacteroidota bacterium]